MQPEIGKGAPKHQSHCIIAHILFPPLHPTARQDWELPQSGVILRSALLDFHPDRPISNANISDVKSIRDLRDLIVNFIIKIYFLNMLRPMYHLKYREDHQYGNI